MTTRLAEAQAALDGVRRQRAQAPPDLFGPRRDAEQVETAIASVGRHASNQWRRGALEAVRIAALQREELTVEDVGWPDDVEPYDDRARGAVMRAAARSGLIASTRTYRPSTRPETHRRPLLVWRSRIHRSEP